MKRILVGCLTAICLFLLCSCGSGVSNNDSATTIASLEQKIAELQERIFELEEENSKLQASGGNTVADNTSTDSNIETPPISMELNTMFTVGDVMDITITSAEWSDSILPPDTSKTYTYYQDKENETYFIVHGTITSHASNSFDIQWNSDSSILINGKYTFSSTMEFVDLDGRGFGESIKPLQTRNFIIYSSVSDEVYNISESVQVSFELPDNEEQLDYFFDEGHSNASYTITFSDLKP